MFGKGLFISVGLALTVSMAAAQPDQCPPIIQTALAQVGNSCASATRNTVCYGNISLNAEAQSDVTQFTFGTVGDTINLADLRSLQASPLDEKNNLWGVAVLTVQANLPDTLPGQNVTVLVYGDSTIEPQLSVTLNVSANDVINVRQTPDTQAAVVGKLSASTTLKADGRLEDNSWVRVALEDGTIGWVNTSVATIAGDLATLKVRTPDDVTPSARQGAFYFKGGIGTNACAQLPDSGLLVQSPEGQEVALTINDVEITVGSTVAIRFLDKVPGATPDDPELPHLAFYVLEGGIKRVALTGATTRVANLPTVKQGLVLYVPINKETGLPNGNAPLIKPYDQDDIDALTVLTTALPQKITPAKSMSAEEFAQLQAIAIQAGAWTFSPSTQPAMCLDNNKPQDIAPMLALLSQTLSGTIRVLGAGDSANTVDAQGKPTTVTGAADGSTIALKGVNVPVDLIMTRTEPDVFSGTSGYGDLSLKLLSPMHGVLRVVTPLTTSTGEQLCAQTEIFLIGTTGQ